MDDHKRFRVLTPDGLLSRDTFLVPLEQPNNIKAGCLLVIHEPSGRQFTVHDTRVFPASATNTLSAGSPTTSVCLKCGKVQGVVGDQVTCPSHGGACGLVEKK